MVNPNIEKLEDARDKIAEVYESEATDDKYDNGSLSEMNDAILHLQIVMQNLIKRDEEE